MTPRLFFRVAGVEARARMSYRLDFWGNFLVGSAAQLAVVYFIWRSVFAESDRATIGGFTFEEMLRYYVAAVLVSRLVRSREFEGNISNDIYQGQLNRYLVFPGPYAGYKYAEHFGGLLPAAGQAVLLAAALIVWGGAGAGITPFSLAGGIAAALLGNFLYWLIGLPIQAVAFWADNVWSLEAAKRTIAAFLGGLMLPITVFPEWARGVLDFLPFRFVFGFPAETILGRVTLAEWLAGMGGALLWCLAFAWFGRAAFRRGLLRYSGIGI